MVGQDYDIPLLLLRKAARRFGAAGSAFKEEMRQGLHVIKRRTWRRGRKCPEILLARRLIIIISKAPLEEAEAT